MRIEKSVVIKRPVDAVFAFVTDMHKVNLWLPVSNIRQLSSSATGVGATFAQTAEFMGQRFDMTIETTEYEPPRVFAFKMIQGPFPLTTKMVFAPLNGDTNLTMIGEAEPGKGLKLAGPFLSTIVKKQLENQVNALKRAVEAEA